MYISPWSMVMIKTLVFALLLSNVHPWQTPGTTPTKYKKDEKVELYLNKLNSIRTQIPYASQHLSFVCSKHETEFELNLGQVLQGESYSNSDFNVQGEMMVLYFRFK